MRFFFSFPSFRPNQLDCLVIYFAFQHKMSRPELGHRWLAGRF